MGYLLSKLVREESGEKRLAAIKTEMDSVKRIVEDSALSQSKYCKRILSSLFVALISIFVYFYFNFPSEWQYRIFYLCILALILLIFWTLLYSLRLYYLYKSKSSLRRLNALKQEQKILIEKIKETETYKRAKEILNKYEEEKETTSSSMPLDLDSSTRRENDTLEKSIADLNQSRLSLPPHTPTKNTQHNTLSFVSPSPHPASNIVKTIRPIFPQSKTLVDKIVEYTVGDGAAHRYALICKNCYAHNGMALKEEFIQGITFRCPYCSALNNPPDSLSTNTTDKEANDHCAEVAEQNTTAVISKDEEVL